MSTLELKTELEWIERAQQGSFDAFERLVTLYQDRLYRFLLVRTANRVDAEDVLQDTFVAAFKYLPAYRPEYRFSTWLFSIALRRLGSVRRPRPDSEALPDSLACGQAGPEQRAIELEQRRSIWQMARSCLGRFQFTALWLFYVEDMPVREIGKIMNRPDAWVRVNLLRARRRLARALREQRSEPGFSCEELIL